MKTILAYTVILIFLLCFACLSPKKVPDPTGSFKADIEFLERFTKIIVLQEPSGLGKIAVSAALQGRVMTSTANGDEGNSYGWINRKLFESRDTLLHINAYGGEERLWLGPEGGQFSIYFEKGTEFKFDNWFTPKFIDREPFNLISSTPRSARFTRDVAFRNYSDTPFKLTIEREVTILDRGEAFAQLQEEPIPGVKLVAYQTKNSLRNNGQADWTKRTGLLSIWILGMYNPSPGMTIVVPYVEGSAEKLDKIVTDDYFGKVPSDRLRVGNGVLFFKADGQYRSKIGLSPGRAKNVLGSFDSETNTLTIVQYNKPEGVTSYVNSKWELQQEPLKGDAVNSYNDGPPSPGVAAMGPFCELETSSPAMELKVGEKGLHIETTFHFQGDDAAIDTLAQHLLGVSLLNIKGAFTGSPIPK